MPFSTAPGARARSCTCGGANDAPYQQCRRGSRRTASNALTTIVATIVPASASLSGTQSLIARLRSASSGVGPVPPGIARARPDLGSLSPGVGPALLPSCHLRNAPKKSVTKASRSAAARQASLPAETQPNRCSATGWQSCRRRRVSDRLPAQISRSAQASCPGPLKHRVCRGHAKRVLILRHPPSAAASAVIHHATSGVEVGRIARPVESVEERLRRCLLARRRAQDTASRPPT